jgi:hypothetical protein
MDHVSCSTSIGTSAQYSSDVQLIPAIKSSQLELRVCQHGCCFCKTRLAAPAARKTRQLTVREQRGRRVLQSSVLSRGFQVTLLLPLLFVTGWAQLLGLLLPLPYECRFLPSWYGGGRR